MGANVAPCQRACGSRAARPALSEASVSRAESKGVTIAACACSSPAPSCSSRRSPSRRAPAQQPPIKDDRLFQSGIEITSVTATVTDHDGTLVTGLDREAFEVFEDGVRQNVTQFTRDRVPIGLGVLLDNSDSMFGRRIQDARAAVNRFLFELLEPVDEFFVMAFNHKPKPLTGWTRAQPDVQRALDGLKPNGGTAIYDTIVEALPMLDVRTKPRGALSSSPTARTRPATSACASCDRRCCAPMASSTRSRSTRRSARRSTPASTRRRCARSRRKPAAVPRWSRTPRNCSTRRRGSPRS